MLACYTVCLQVKNTSGLWSKYTTMVNVIDPIDQFHHHRDLVGVGFKSRPMNR